MGESPVQPAVASDLPVAIDVSLDRLQVTLAVQTGAVPKPADAAGILARLGEMGVKLTPANEEQVHELCRRKPNRTPVVVAQGTSPIHDTPPTVALISPLDATTPREVTAEEAVARVVPGKDGTDGVDVFGKPIPRRHCDALPPVGDNLKLASDGVTFVAAVAGVLRVRRQGASQLIGVATALNHKDDVTSDLGSLEYPGDVIINGSIRGGAIVRAGGSIRVSGDVEAEEVLSGGELLIDGAINARSQSHYTVAGDLIARAIQGARVDVGGSITVSTNILHSRIACRGRLKVDGGDIVNSHVTAGGGVVCQTIGAANFSKALIEVGIDERLRNFAHNGVPEIAAHRDKAARIRKTIEPLLKSATPLNPVQKNRVRALLLEADLLEQTADRMTLDLRAEFEFAATRFNSEVIISHTAFPGITLRFPGVETTLRMAIRGPCRIAAQATGGAARILLYENGKSTGVPLEMRQCADDWLDTIKRAAA